MNLEYEPNDRYVYLSGPITGNPTYETLFQEAMHFSLQNLQLPVWNPVWLEQEAEEFGISLVNQAWYMRRSIEELLKCNEIWMLRGWENSSGALLEKSIAEKLGYKVFFFDGLYTTLTSLPAVNKSEVLNPLLPLEETIDEEARRIVYGDRDDVYGPATGDFTRTGKMWGAILGSEPISPDRVALCMMALKISRLHNTPTHRDSQTDIIGYMLCYNDIVEKRHEKLLP